MSIIYYNAVSDDWNAVFIAFMLNGIAGQTAIPDFLYIST